MGMVGVIGRKPATARKYALKALAMEPFSVETLKTVACAIRGFGILLRILSVVCTDDGRGATKFDACVPELSAKRVWPLSVPET